MILAVAGLCSAAPRVAIVLRPSAAADATGFEVQLGSELRAAGFEVVMVSAVATTPQELEALAEKSQSVAAISIEQPPGGVTASVWVTERMTGKTLLRSVRPEKISPEAPSIVALRAVELLRASLLELNENHPPRGSMPVPASVRAWIAPEPKSRPVSPDSRPLLWGVAMGATLLGAPGGVPASVGPALGFLWHPDAIWTGELRWEGPYFGTVQSDIGSSSVSQEMLTLRIRLEPWGGQSTFSPWVAVGMGGHHLGSHGRAASPYSGRTEGGYTAVALAALGMRARAGRGFYVVPEFNVAVAATRPVVHFADRSAVHTGRPWLSGTLSLEYVW